jgi:hypothetical protein
MPQHVRIWEIAPNGDPRDLVHSKVNLESRLEEWLARDISMVGTDLLIIGKQVQTDFGGIIDILCIDSAGDLVIVELKRDKTPREITAQVLDYASWVADLDNQRITDIANTYLGVRGPLESAFSKQFGVDLPDVLNESHKMLVVAASIDTGSERIIRYLSTHHGVNINAVTFQFFRSSGESDFLARVFLSEPTDVEQRSRSIGRSKRKPRLTLNEFHALAEEAGVGAAYDQILKIMKPYFGAPRPTRSTVNLVRNMDGSRQAVINLVPSESDPVQGVRFQIYAKRLAEVTGVPEDELFSVLPAGTEPWAFSESDDPNWQGWTGYWKPEDADRLRQRAFHSVGA